MPPPLPQPDRSAWTLSDATEALSRALPIDCDGADARARVTPILVRLADEPSWLSQWFARGLRRPGSL